MSAGKGAGPLPAPDSQSATERKLPEREQALGCECRSIASGS